MLIKFFTFFFIIILYFTNSNLFSEIPIIVIAPSKKAQSLSTVGTSVTVLDETFFKIWLKSKSSDTLDGSDCLTPSI